MLQKAESLARRAEQLVSVAPRELITVTPAVRAEAYEGLQQIRRRSLTEVAQDLGHPLARAIIFHELVGPPLALRRPERTFADYG